MCSLKPGVSLGGEHSLCETQPNTLGLFKQHLSVRTEQYHIDLILTIRASLDSLEMCLAGVLGSGCVAKW